jgi:hypothetical protein
MSSESEEQDIKEYLVKNDYIDLYVFLITSADNLRCRGNLLIWNIESLKQGLQQLCNEIGGNPDIAQSDKGMNQKFKDLHYLELEVIQRINIFIELLAVYYHFSRENIRVLPRAIGENEFSLSQEYRFFNRQKIYDIYKNFKYPNVENFTEISAEEKKVLSEILAESANKTREYFKDAYRFKRHFMDVYNKYKHVMSEVTGVYGINKDKKIIESRFYVRHKIVDKKGTRYNVFAVPLSWDTLQYFETVSRATWTLLMFLIENQLLALANQGRDIVPKHLAINQEAGEKIRQITAKITSYKQKEFNTIIKVNPPKDKALQNKISKAFKDNSIYLMKNDIFDIESLKRGSIDKTSP